MKTTFISTAGDDEIVVLPRREYDILLARAGDEAAEDRVTDRIIADYRARAEAGETELAPAWLTDGLLDGATPIAAARHHAGLTQAQLAAALQMRQSYLSEMESGTKRGTVETITRLAEACGVEARWLLDEGEGERERTTRRQSRTRSRVDEKQTFVERREQGDYAVRRPDSQRAIAVEPTQRKAIARARELSPERTPLVERVRTAPAGRRDKWRKP